MDPALVPDFEGRYLENEKRFFKNNFETVFWGPNSIIRNQLVKTLQLTFKTCSEFQIRQNFLKNAHFEGIYQNFPFSNLLVTNVPEIQE